MSTGEVDNYYFSFKQPAFELERQEKPCIYSGEKILLMLCVFLNSPQPVLLLPCHGVSKAA